MSLLLNSGVSVEMQMERGSLMLNSGASVEMQRTQRDTERHREAQRDTERHRERGSLMLNSGVCL